METIGEALFKRIQNAYELLDLPIPQTPNDSSEMKDVIDHLGTIESRIPDMECAVSPSSFDPNDPELRAYPRQILQRWTSLERALEASSASGIMSRLPLFWQIEEMLFNAARVHGAPIFLNDRANMPAGAAALRDASLNTVLTDTTDAHTFAGYLSGVPVQFPRAWIIVHPVASETWSLPLVLETDSVRVAQEVHLFPGVPMLEQCSAITETKESFFHISDNFTIQLEDRAYITSSSDQLFPIFRLALPHALKDSGTCT